MKKKLKISLDTREKTVYKSCAGIFYICSIIKIITFIIYKHYVYAAILFSVMFAYFIFCLLTKKRNNIPLKTFIVFIVMSLCFYICAVQDKSLIVNMIPIVGQATVSVLMFNKKATSILSLINCSITLFIIFLYKNMFFGSEVTYSIIFKAYLYFVLIHIFACVCATFTEILFGESSKQINESKKLNDKISGEITKVKEMHAKQSEATGQIKDVAVSVKSIANNIHDAVDNLSVSTSNQASAVEEVTATISNVQNYAETNSQHAEKLLTVAQHTIENANTSSVQMKEMIQSIREIKDASTRIREITRDIKSISTQTNMLSLNASIEAVSAGQHGKGFSVVASEIRTLAEKSAVSAKSTDEFIDSILELIDKGDKIVMQTADSINMIFEDINTLGESIQEISQLSESQKESMGQISITMQSIAGDIQSNAATAEQTAATSQMMIEESNKLNTVADTMN